MGPRVLFAVMASVLVLGACGAPQATSGGARGSETGGEAAPDGDEGSTVARHDAHAPDCGSSVDDWCAAPAGDPCGAHAEAPSCRSDVRCEGIPYSGESLAACTLDARCFASNCPTVGCISRCETLGEQACELHGYRCSWNGSQCERVEACHE